MFRMQRWHCKSNMCIHDDFVTDDNMEQNLWHVANGSLTWEFEKWAKGGFESLVWRILKHAIMFERPGTYLIKVCLIGLSATPRIEHRVRRSQILNVWLSSPDGLREPTVFIRLKWWFVVPQKKHAGWSAPALKRQRGYAAPVQWVCTPWCSGMEQFIVVLKCLKKGDVVLVC